MFPFQLKPPSIPPPDPLLADNSASCFTGKIHVIGKELQQTPPCLLLTRTVSVLSAFLTCCRWIAADFSRANLLLITISHPFLPTQRHHSCSFLSFLHHQYFLSSGTFHLHKTRSYFFIVKNKQNPLERTFPATTLLLCFSFSKIYWKKLLLLTAVSKPSPPLLSCIHSSQAFTPYSLYYHASILLSVMANCQLSCLTMR